MRPLHEGIAMAMAMAVNRLPAVRAALRALGRRAAVVTLALGLVAVGGPALAAGAGTASADACPPVPEAPTQAQMQAGRAAARDRGLLWRLQRDGRISHLFGTVHLGRFEWVFPGGRVAQALREADVLALELDLTDPAQLRTLQQSIDDGGRSAARLPPALRARLRRQIDAACLQAERMAQQHPVMQVSTLAVLAGRRDGLDPVYAQEFALSAAARALQRPVVSLETPQRQLQALIPDDEDAVLHFVGDTLTQLEDGRGRRALNRMAQAWEAGDLDTLAHYETWCECVADAVDRAVLRRLNDERNPGLAQAIEALHAGGQRVFAAVGVLHMTGPMALPGLLRERGFVVERVLFAP